MDEVTCQKEIEGMIPSEKEVVVAYRCDNERPLVKLIPTIEMRVKANERIGSCNVYGGNFFFMNLKKANQESVNEFLDMIFGKVDNVDRVICL